MSCVLRVSGEDFDPGTFLDLRALPIYEFFRKGDVKYPAKTPLGERKYACGGFQCNVSSCGFDDLPGQIDDAIAFLNKFESELRALQCYSKIDSKTLDFALDLRISEQNHWQFEYLPPELLLLCGQLGIGIEMSIYPVDMEERARKLAVKKRVWK